MIVKKFNVNVFITANKVHISQTTYVLLSKTGKYMMKKRGTIDIKVSLPVLIVKSFNIY